MCVSAHEARGQSPFLGETFQVTFLRSPWGGGKGRSALVVWGGAGAPVLFVQQYGLKPSQFFP